MKGSGEHIVDLPDAVAMGVVLWDDIVIESLPCYCYACTLEQAAYGQVIVDDGSVLAVSDGFANHEPNAIVCRTLDNQVFKEKMFELLLK